MILLSVLIVLAVERVTTKSLYWQADFYYGHYHNAIVRWGWLRDSSAAPVILALGLMPAFLLLLLLGSLHSHLLVFLANTALLMICVGCPKQRASYKGYLQAANRGDMQACSLFADQMGYDADGELSFGQRLVWINYSHYAAVTLWFVAFGGAGAVLYVTARYLAQTLAQGEHPQAESAKKLLFVLDWLPVRITALGFLLVGHFSRALPVWLSSVSEVNLAPQPLLCRVAKAAEEVDPSDEDCTEEPCILVRLAKRNVMLLLVGLSVLTLSGVMS